MSDKDNMWPYDDHNETNYNKALEFVENYSVSLGAQFICTKEEKFTTFVDNKTITEVSSMNVFKYKDDYFWVEPHFLPDKPFMVFSFGDTIENIFEDADPFPYDLSEEDLKYEVRCSLGIDGWF